MKKILLAGVAALVTSLSNAVPIDFQVTGSSLSTAGSGLALSHYDDNAFSFSLDDYETENVNFGSIVVKGFEVGDLALTINFAAPVNDDVTGTGTYKVLGTFVYNSGKLKWDGPTTVAYNYLGNVGSFDISFDDIDTTSWFSLPIWNLTGSITNNGSQVAAVPEPATLALLGLGIAGLGVARRRTAA